MDLLNKYFSEIFSTSSSKSQLDNKTNEQLDKFIKESFIYYLNRSSLFNNYVKVYENKGDFKNECKDLYILSETLYKKAIKKINIPFDIKFKNKSFKDKSLYIFNLNDIHNDDFIYKGSKNNRIVKPIKQKFLCKLVAIIFVKLYILVKGIYTTFNHNLDYDYIQKNIRKQQELLGEKTGQISEEPSEEPPIEEPSIEETPIEEPPIEEPPIEEPPIEEPPQEPLEESTGNLFEESTDITSDSNSDKSEELVGGGVIDDTVEYIVNLFNRKNDDDDDDDDEDNEDVDNETSNMNEYKSSEDDSSDLLEEDINKKEVTKQIININYNNVFFAFINSICGNESYNDLENKFNLPTNLDILTNNLKKSKIFDVLCDNNNIYSAFKKNNILFNENNLSDIYKNSDRLLNSIKEIEKNLDYKYYGDEIKDKTNDLKNLLESFDKYNSLCYKLSTDFEIIDKERIFERIMLLVKKMIEDYTTLRNRLYKDIISKLFIFEDKIVKIQNENEDVERKLKVIVDIKDTVTYKEIIRLTNSAKLITLDLYTQFFETLKELFDLLKMSGIIIAGETTNDEDSMNNTENVSIEEPSEEQSEEQSEEPSEEPTEEIKEEPTEEIKEESPIEESDETIIKEPTSETQEPTSETQEPTSETQEPTPEPTSETPEPTSEMRAPISETPEPTSETPEPTSETQAPTSKLVGGKNKKRNRKSKKRRTKRKRSLKKHRMSKKK